MTLTGNWTILCNPESRYLIRSSVRPTQCGRLAAETSAIMTGSNMASSNLEHDWKLET